LHLKEKLEQRQARVGVIGLGYVGLPLAVEFAKAGIRRHRIRRRCSKVTELNAGRSYILDVKTEDIAACVKAGRLRATTDMSKLGEMDAVDICVPTPLRKTKDPDMSYVVSAAEEIAKYIHPGMLIVLESTTYPGTTAEVLQPMFEARGLTVGEDFYLAFSPERVDPANEKFNTRNTPKVVGGTTPACSEVAGGVVLGRGRHRRAGQLHAGRGDGETPGEHLQSCQHRPGERDRVDVASHEDRRLGSDRRGEDQAIRFHAVLPGPRSRRPLHSD
jgi:UDP-N-acetyl-D-glucosamine dehydrogenase